MLVDKQDSNVLPLLREPIKSLLDRGVFRFCINDQEILLGIWGLSDMLGEDC